MTLGEILAVAAVGISALTLWDSHQERVRTEEKAVATADRADAEAAVLVLRATPSRDGDRLTLAPLNPEQAIQAQTILFPSALKLPPVETTGDPRIEADWFAEPLKRARKGAGQKDEDPGDQRLPIIVVTHYLAGGARHTSRAIHDLGYTLEGRFLRGSAVTLRGMSIVRTVKEEGAQAALDAVWTGRHRSAG
ncbi:hypothetical protein [Sphingomonas profundi]|uniref:hypothetical protein n=1 Tax=Alterirhizorhabdus profundi TaxID=2681549 RepID=UPI001E559DF8|nr:hypothetical protein [Sphingomonas profundi]